MEPCVQGFASSQGHGGGWQLKYKTMRFFEFKPASSPTKPLNPQQARLRALQAQVEQARRQLAAERERQRRAKAAQKLSIAA